MFINVYNLRPVLRWPIGLIFNILIRFIHWKGNQAKIYIRPIQTSLDTTPKDQREVLSDAKVSCKTWHCLLSVCELRNHVSICVVGKYESVDELQDMDSDDLPDREINRHEQLSYINPTQSFIPVQMTDQEANFN